MSNRRGVRYTKKSLRALVSTPRKLGKQRKQTQERGAKYGNEIVMAHGHRFDSRAEYDHFQQLQILERCGEISHLIPHPKAYTLQPAFTDQHGVRHRAITYTPDFAFTEAGRDVVVDVKGKETEVFRIKAKMFRYHYPDIELRLEHVGNKKKKNK